MPLLGLAINYRALAKKLITANKPGDGEDSDEL